MASPSPPFSNLQDAKSAATTLLWQVYHQRPRSQQAKTVAYIAIACLLFLWILLSSSAQSEPDFWTKFPSRPYFPERPEDALVALPRKPGLTANETLPVDPEKNVSHLHVLIPATKGSRGACRTMTSAMILGYPPPTLVGYDHEKPGATEFERTVDRITRIRNYLKTSRTVNDRDIVLIVDAVDVFFQLPPRILVERFQDILRTNNRKLQKKYGFATVQNAQGAPLEQVQKYSQQVIFGASKLCYGGLLSDPGCVSVPESSLPPDVYGWKTDVYPDGHLNRPRWLNPGAVIGQAADLRLIYDEVLRVMEQRHKKHGDYQALTQIFGKQEVVRELERRRTANRLKESLYEMLGISDAVNITGISVRLEAGHRYEYGIGVDYESQLFFNQILSRNDVEWVKFNNITKTSLLQGQFGVPREHRLLLPEDIASLPNPFNQTRFAKEQTTSPEWNATLDKLPNPDEHSWHNVPLMTNPHSASVPVLAHLNGDPKLRNAWWEQMWFFPWARALLRRYVRSSHGFDAAQSALLGGQDWWEMRGGRGGLWTDEENWVTLSEVCEGQERDLFDDDLGPWAKENGDPEDPVYNRFGNLIRGKEREDEVPLKRHES
ncbi:hypothetical protein N7462_002350 [Penicillium macrosclerotiorum]|uniref:uncharacterized protein n=1 Tax=Penicillium macrosclerotiorum TaxID=303699 RepID=UPI00254879EB|nr:uncharacterized protein N7462_002350 [Penicillium macrosclerotiorum]KAJ5692927.1 hypothetical protein N7462_002350 [Penicillium macrosclerotiorum]